MCHEYELYDVWKFEAVPCFLTSETEVVLYLAVLENSVLPMGWNSSHKTPKWRQLFTNVLYAPWWKTPNDVRSLPPYSVNCEKCKEIIRFYSVIVKKNNQSSVSDADREIPTLWSTGNAGNSVDLVSGLTGLPSGWGFSFASETNDRFFCFRYRLKPYRQRSEPGCSKHH